MRLWTRSGLVTALFAFSFALGGMRFAAAQDEPAASGDKPALEVKVFSLQHAPASNAAETLDRLFSHEILLKMFPKEPDLEVRVSVNAATNSVTILAPEAVHKLFEAVLLKMEDEAKHLPAGNSVKGSEGTTPGSQSVAQNRTRRNRTPKEDEDPLELKIFQPRHASARDMVNHFQNLYRGEYNARVDADPRTNSVFIRAPHGKVAEIEILLNELDRPSAQNSQIGTADTNDANSLDATSGRAARRMTGNVHAANRSPKLQQLESAALAAAQAYRRQLAISPKDDAQLAKLKGDLQGAVQAAFQARQEWQRQQVAEMRVRLEQIEKNISARSQRSGEIIERRVEELLHPESGWDSDADAARPAMGSQAAFTSPAADAERVLLQSKILNLVTEEKLLLEQYGANHPQVQGMRKRIELAHEQLKSFNALQTGGVDPIAVPADRQNAHTSGPQRTPVEKAPRASLAAMTSSIWKTNLSAALVQAQQSRRPLLAYFRDEQPPCQKFEDQVLTSTSITELLSNHFVTVVLDLSDPRRVAENQAAVAAHQVTAAPTFLIFHASGSGVRKTQGSLSIGDLEAILRNEIADSDSPTWMTDYPAAKARAETLNRMLVIRFHHKDSDEAQGLLEEIARSKYIRSHLSRFVLVNVDLDASPDPQLLKQYEVTEPMVKIVRSDGKPIFDAFKVDLLKDRWELERLLTQVTRIVQAPEAAQAPNAKPATAEPELRTDPISTTRKRLLDAENAVQSAKAALVEAEVALEGPETKLARLVELSKRGVVPESELLEIRAEVRRKQAALARVKVELSGRERELALAKEHIEAQVQTLELEVQQLSSKAELADKEYQRYAKALTSKAVSQSEYDQKAAEARVARLAQDNAQLHLQLLRRALPGDAAGNDSNRGDP